LLVCVSVIIPVLDEAEGLPELLDTLRQLPAQVLFIDGGSSDASTALLEASGFRWISSARGRAAQMNAGAAAATGDIFMFLHADTKLPPDAVARVRHAVRRGAVGGSFAVRLDSNRPLLRLVGRLISWRSRLTRIASGDQALFVTREAFERLGGFAGMVLFEDIDFSRRLRRLGPVVQLRARVTTSARRWERHGALRTIARMWVLRALYYCRVDPELLARHYGIAR
jgi:rSAM/selenodomain-associated transferase 2